MKQISVIILFVVCCIFNGYGRGKLDLMSRSRLTALNLDAVGSVEPLRYVSAILKIDADSAVAQIEKMGVSILRRREDLLLAYVPLDSIESIEKILSVSRMSVGTTQMPMMDKARTISRIDDILSNENVINNYDGSGVVVGFSDIGFDPNHINFIDAASGASRVKFLSHYVDSIGERIVKQSADEISQWTTDNLSEWHATHVAGILAGSYKANGMQGVATGADIVATTSSLYDASILAGVEDVVEYAKHKGKPAVVNLSLGSYIGPHDGTDLFCQYLDRIGEEAIVCIAAGNNGHRKNVHKIDFTEDGQEFKTIIADYINWNGVQLYGNADFWSIDASEFQAAICIYDRTSKAILFTSQFVGGESGRDKLYICSEKYEIEDAEHNDVFENSFEGFVQIESELNPENGRYNILVSFDLLNKDYYTNIGRYCLGIIIKGDGGQHIDGYADGIYSYFQSAGVAGFSDGQADGSISNIACGDNVIVVGASNSRNTTPLIDGSTPNYNFEIGGAANFSGYGTLIDGRVLPHVCAPGNMVVSSVSTPYVLAQNEEFINKMADVEVVEGKSYYWYTECGTSMSTPLVAGIIALWLQADPSLSVADARDIAVNTASKDVLNIDDPRWGAGNIDAFAGLKEVISRSGIVGMEKALNAVVIKKIGDDYFEISVPETLTGVTINIFDILGRKIKQCACVENAISIDVSSMSEGIYLMEVIGGKSRIVERLIVK